MRLQPPPEVASSTEGGGDGDGDGDDDDDDHDPSSPSWSLPSADAFGGTKAGGGDDDDEDDEEQPPTGDGCGSEAFLLTSEPTEAKCVDVGGGGRGASETSESGVSVVQDFLPHSQLFLSSLLTASSPDGFPSTLGPSSWYWWW